MSRGAALALMVAAVGAAVVGAAAASAETVAPYGLTFTLDPATTADGSWEVEVGGRADDGTTLLPAALKFGASADLELALLVGGEDLTLQARTMLARGDWSLALLPKLAVDREPGATTRSAGLALLASHAVGRGGVTVNLGAVVDDAPGGSTSRAELAADLAHPVGTDGAWARTSWFLGGLVTRDSTDSTTRSVGVGLTHRFDDATQLDLAWRREDIGGADAAVLMLNLTRNLGRAGAQ